MDRTFSSVARMGAIALVAITLIVILSLLPRSALSDATSLTGYVWSDTIGWISLNCSNTNSCGTSNYAVSVGSDGSLTGYAWSDNIGWISANASDLAGCPSGACSASFADGALTGWMKALAGGTAGSGGWDGWISLNGANYGPTHTSGIFSGYAWGSTVVGWIDFSPALGICPPSYSCSGQTIQHTDSSCALSSVTTCVGPAFCSAGSAVCLYPPISYIDFTSDDGDSYGGHLTAHPQLVSAGLPVKLFWNLGNVSSCTIIGTDGERFTGDSSGSAGKITDPITQQTIFTLACTALPNATPPSISESVTVNVLPVFQEK